MNKPTRRYLAAIAGILSLIATLSLAREGDYTTGSLRIFGALLFVSGWVLMRETEQKTMHVLVRNTEIIDALCAQTVGVVFLLFAGSFNGAWAQSIILLYLIYLFILQNWWAGLMPVGPFQKGVQLISALAISLAAMMLIVYWLSGFDVFFGTLILLVLLSSLHISYIHLRE